LSSRTASRSPQRQLEDASSPRGAAAAAAAGGRAGLRAARRRLRKLGLGPTSPGKVDPAVDPLLHSKDREIATVRQTADLLLARVPGAPMGPEYEQAEHDGNRDVGSNDTSMAALEQRCATMETEVARLSAARLHLTDPQPAAPASSREALDAMPMAQGDRHRVHWSSGRSPKGLGDDDEMGHERWSFLVDNTWLEAHTKGLGFRRSQNMADQDDDVDVAPWGSTITGVRVNDAWVEVGNRFLPTRIEGLPVLVRCGVASVEDEEATPVTRRLRLAAGAEEEEGAEANIAEEVMRAIAGLVSNVESDDDADARVRSMAQNIVSEVLMTADGGGGGADRRRTLAEGAARSIRLLTADVMTRMLALPDSARRRSRHAGRQCIGSLTEAVFGELASRECGSAIIAAERRQTQDVVERMLAEEEAREQSVGERQAAPDAGAGPRLGAHVLRTMRAVEGLARASAAGPAEEAEEWRRRAGDVQATVEDIVYDALSSPDGTQPGPCAALARETIEALIANLLPNILVMAAEQAAEGAAGGAPSEARRREARWSLVQRARFCLDALVDAVFTCLAGRADGGVHSAAIVDAERARTEASVDQMLAPALSEQSDCLMNGAEANSLQLNSIHMMRAIEGLAHPTSQLTASCQADMRVQAVAQAIASDAVANAADSAGPAHALDGELARRPLVLWAAARYIKALTESILPSTAGLAEQVLRGDGDASARQQAGEAVAQIGRFCLASLTEAVFADLLASAGPGVAVAEERRRSQMLEFADLALKSGGGGGAAALTAEASGGVVDAEARTLDIVEADRQIRAVARTISFDVLERQNSSDGRAGAAYGGSAATAAGDYVAALSRSVLPRLATAELPGAAAGAAPPAAALEGARRRSRSVTARAARECLASLSEAIFDELEAQDFAGAAAGRRATGGERRRTSEYIDRMLTEEVPDEVLMERRGAKGADDAAGGARRGDLQRDSIRVMRAIETLVNATAPEVAEWNST